MTASIISPLTTVVNTVMTISKKVEPFRNCFVYFESASLNQRSSIFRAQIMLFLTFDMYCLSAREKCAVRLEPPVLRTLVTVCTCC